MSNGCQTNLNNDKHRRGKQLKLVADQFGSFVAHLARGKYSVNAICFHQHRSINDCNRNCESVNA